MDFNDLNKQSEEIIGNVSGLRNLGMKDKEIIKTLKQTLKGEVTGKKDLKFLQDMVIEALNLIKAEQLENRELTNAHQKKLAESLMDFANAYKKVENINLNSMKPQKSDVPIEIQILGALSKQSQSSEELSDLLHIPEETIIKEIQDLSKKGYEIEKDDNEYVLLKQAKIIDTTELVLPIYENKFRIGVVSDTHGGSIYEQLTLLHETYDFFEARGINTVFHLGDISAGVKKYASEDEVHKQCIQRVGNKNVHNGNIQKNWIVKNFPKRKDMTTYVIGGVFDQSHMKYGYNIIKAIAAERDDIKDLGLGGKAIVSLQNGITIELIHPNKLVTPYALSYRPQKIIEGKGRRNLPDAILFGQTHTMLEVPYNGIYGITVGCFEGRSKRFEDDARDISIGGAIIGYTAEKNGNLCYCPYGPRPEYITFASEIKNDYKNY